MRRPKVLLAVMFMFLLLGIANLIRNSEKVRFHEFVQTAGGGAMIGVALVGIVVCCLRLSGKLRLADKKPAAAQPTPPEKTAQA